MQVRGGIYTDKHTVFRFNKLDGLHGDGMTQFGRALKALTIEIIYANLERLAERQCTARKQIRHVAIMTAVIAVAGVIVWVRLSGPIARALPSS